jgi:pimeloyl-ACP methyl ester carboxylesterase
MGQSWSRPFADAGYTVWWVTRRQNMPAGHSFADMANDYAQVIGEEFGGKVDLVLGMSTGGQIGFYLAAGHPETFRHIVIVAAGYADAEHDKDLLLRSARLLSQGRTGEAMALFVDDMYPRVPRPARRILGEVMGRSMYGKTHPHFANDVMVEAEAEAASDAREVLPDITIPVLLVGGDQDPYFPKEMFQDTAGLIPDCTLRLYEGKGHEGLLSEKRFVQDVLAFIAEHPAAQPEPATEQPETDDQLGVAT